MKVYRFRNRNSEPSHAVLTIGNFDGVHRGHQALIRQVVREAGEMGAESGLLTFDPHPQTVLREHPVPMLTSLPLRLKLFEETGLDAACIIPFTRELSRMTPEAFVQEYLIGRFHLRKLIIGYDFAFGRGRSGTAEVLEALSRQHGFEFEVFPEVEHDGETVSSSRIREALQAGDLERAERLLGRCYSVMESVREGLRRGRELGFPTINQVPDQPLALRYGVYASQVLWNGRAYDGVSNYGVKPTVGAEAPVLETYLFDFDADLYGEMVEVVLLRHLRPEMKFDALDALKHQIADDCDAARGYLQSVER